MQGPPKKIIESSYSVQESRKNLLVKQVRIQLKATRLYRACYEQHLKWRLESHLVDLHVIPMEFVKKLSPEVQKSCGI